MALIHTNRASARCGQPQFVPGSTACAASARRGLLVPTAFPLSSTLKIVSGALSSPVQRLAPASA